MLKVRRPTRPNSRSYKPGALVIAIMDPYGNEAALEAMAEAGVAAFAMELMPRITRAQVDGRAVEPGEPRRLSRGDRRRRRIRPRAADDDDGGRHRAGRARCSSWASASPACRRSRPRAGSAPSSPRPTCGRRPRSRCESLGAKFLAVEDEEFKQAETAGGYAKEMSKEYQAKQAALVAEHIKKQDIVITTALIPGRPAPRLISAGDGGVDEAGLGASSISRSSAAAMSKARSRARSRRSTASRSSATSTWRAGSPRPRPASTPRTCYASSKSWSTRRRRRSRSTGTTRSSRRPRSRATAPSCIRASSRKRAACRSFTHAR